MQKILGTDTGGTYTDGVSLQSDTQQLLYKTKTFPARRDLRFGAPVRAWSKKSPDSLKTEVFIPEHADTANAIVAVMAQTVKRHEILIRVDPVTKKNFPVLYFKYLFLYLKYILFLVLTLFSVSHIILYTNNYNNQ